MPAVMRECSCAFQGTCVWLRHVPAAVLAAVCSAQQGNPLGSGGGGGPSPLPPGMQVGPPASWDMRTGRTAQAWGPPFLLLAPCGDFVGSGTDCGSFLSKSIRRAGGDSELLGTAREAPQSESACGRWEGLCLPASSPRSSWNIWTSGVLGQPSQSPWFGNGL